MPRIAARLLESLGRGPAGHARTVFIRIRGSMHTSRGVESSRREEYGMKSPSQWYAARSSL